MEAVFGHKDKALRGAGQAILTQARLRFRPVRRQGDGTMRFFRTAPFSETDAAVPSGTAAQ